MPMPRYRRPGERLDRGPSGPNRAWNGPRRRLPPNCARADVLRERIEALRRRGFVAEAEGTHRTCQRRPRLTAQLKQASAATPRPPLRPPMRCARSMPNGGRRLQVARLWQTWRGETAEAAVDRLAAGRVTMVSGRAAPACNSTPPDDADTRHGARDGADQRPRPPVPPALGARIHHCSGHFLATIVAAGAAPSSSSVATDWPQTAHCRHPVSAGPPGTTSVGALSTPVTARPHRGAGSQAIASRPGTAIQDVGVEAGRGQERIATVIFDAIHSSFATKAGRAGQRGTEADGAARSGSERTVRQGR